MFVFKVDEGREDPSPTLSGPLSARQGNAIKWCFSGMFRSCDFSGDPELVLLENPIFL